VESDIEAVFRANEAFYHAFETLDIRKMDAIWSEADYVKCIHPGWVPRMGWVQVRDSWVTIFNHTLKLHLSVCVMETTVRGDIGWTVCQEHIHTAEEEGAGLVMATNMFERTADGWRLIHHHGSPTLAPHEETDHQLPMV
jgi:ketosteroid isomerase-like protein